MTATTIVGASVASPSSFGRLAGFAPLFRKDVTEWARGRRAWIVAIATTLFMTLTAANGWITNTIAATLPDGTEVPDVGSLVPLDNIFAAVGSQLFVIATIFAVASLLVREREAGTLAWVASKPVTRSSIWLSKWASASGMLAVSAAIVPLGLTVALVAVLYGVPPMDVVAALGAGMIAIIAFYAALGLAAGTVMPSQPAVAATGLGVMAFVPMIAGLLPFDVAPYLPTSILTWFGEALAGRPVTIVTPVAWAVATGALVALSVRQMRRIEL